MDKILDKENERLKTLIDNKAAEIGFETKIIYDGVAFPKKYTDSNPRVLWLLKESYETNNCYGWHVSNIEKPIPQMHKNGTLRQVCRISYSILNNSNYYKNSSVSDIELLDSFQKIGWININKIAAGKKSPNDLTFRYNIWKDILKEQITTYDPDIIICGNTLQYLTRDNFFEKSSNNRRAFKEGRQYCYYLLKDRLYINIHHPSYFKIHWNECLDEVLNAVSCWDKEMEKKIPVFNR